MDRDMFTVEKTETLQSQDKQRSVFVVAGTRISMDQARDLGLVNDDRAKLLKANAERAQAQGSADFTDVGPESDAHKAFLEEQEAAAAAEQDRVNEEARAQLDKRSTRNKGAAPENRAQ